jgi:hypothetical protein
VHLGSFRVGLLEEGTTSPNPPSPSRKTLRRVVTVLCAR